MPRDFTYCSRARRTAVVVAALLVLFSAAAACAQTLEAFTEPCETVRVASAEPGIVATIELTEGQHVSAGQLIASLETDVLDASLASARAMAESRGALAAAEATFNLRRVRHEKLGQLLAEGHASSEELERAESDRAVAEAELVSVREKIEQAGLEVKRIEAQIERRKIRSPIDGVVIRLDKRPGELVAAGDALIATVVRLAELRVRFYLPTQQAVGLKKDGRIRLLLPQSNQAATGRVDFISPVTDSESGTVRVELIIDNADAEYRSGVPCVLAGDAAVTRNP